MSEKDLEELRKLQENGQLPVQGDNMSKEDQVESICKMVKVHQWITLNSSKIYAKSRIFSSLGVVLLV